MASRYCSYLEVCPDKSDSHSSTFVPECYLRCRKASFLWCTKITYTKYTWYKISSLNKQTWAQDYYVPAPSVVAVEELQCLACIFEATVCSPIRWRASMIPFHVGCLSVREQQISISCLQRAMSPRKVLSIALSSWPSSPNLTPSECQSTTASSAFESSFRLGVAGAVSREITWLQLMVNTVKVLNAPVTFSPCTYQRAGSKLTFRRSFSRVRSFSHLCCLLFQ